MSNNKQSSVDKYFIPYEEALELKELGFNGNYIAYYTNDGKLQQGEMWKDKDSIKAPLFQQAFRWFREKYKLHSSIDFQKLKESDDDDDIALFEYKINEQWQVGKDWYDFRFGFKHHSVSYNHVSYEEAELACLRKLIGIVFKGGNNEIYNIDTHK